MSYFSKKTVFITGGAGGFGFSMAKQFGLAGASIMLADINKAALEKAVSNLHEMGINSDLVECDVTERASMHAASQKTQERFGPVHVLLNNAGVLTTGAVSDLSPSDWEWVFAVNVIGVVNGISAFLPSMKDHGQAAHIVNMSSIAGLKGMPFSGAYAASKSAVIGLSESLSAELDGSNIKVTILCPSFMKTNFFSSGEKRQSRYGGPSDIWHHTNTDVKKYLTSLLEAGDNPDIIAKFAVQSIQDGELFVTTNPNDKQMILERFTDISNSFDNAKKNLKK